MCHAYVAKFDVAQCEMAFHKIEHQLKCNANQKINHSYAHDENDHNISTWWNAFEILLKSHIFEMIAILEMISNIFENNGCHNQTCYILKKLKCQTFFDFIPRATTGERTDN